MEHKHSVFDTDTHFIIAKDTREIKLESNTAPAIVQHDHNSERLSFELPRYIDGHDMTLCNEVQVHYLNVDSSTKEPAKGVYSVEDLGVLDENTAVCSWLISENATQYAGKLNFMIRFSCIADDGSVSYRWNTGIYTDLAVVGAYDNGEAVTEDFPDILAQWKAELFGIGDTEEQRLLHVSAEQQAAITAKGQAVLESIPDKYEALQKGVDTLFNSVASGIRGNLSGEIVRAGDVSPIKHEMQMKVQGKNLFDVSKIPTATASASYAYISEVGADYIVVSTEEGYDGNGYCTVAKTVREVCPSLEIGKIYILTASTESNSTNIYLPGIQKSWIFGRTMVMTKEILDSTMTFYGLSAREGMGTGDCRISNIQIEEGETATEYTPYIDPATVTVCRCGKNILGFADDFEINQDGLVVSYDSTNRIFTINGTPEKASFSINFGSHLFDIFGFPIGTDVALSIEHISGTLSAESLTNVFYMGCSDTPGGGRNNWFSVPFPVKGRKTNISKAIKNYLSRTWLYIGGEYNVTFANYKFRVQLEVGTEATEYEDFKGVKHTPGTDGIISGMVSACPNMTILTDRTGMNIECEYIVDTKTYIDTKIAELMAK